MASKYKSPSFTFGTAMGEANINIYLPLVMKRAVKKLADNNKVSATRYCLNLIIRDAVKKDKKFKAYMDNL